jgi:hypothetical protein
MGSPCCKKSDSDNNDEKTQVNDPEMICMWASAAILIGGFCVVAFVSGPLGLLLTLLTLSGLGLYYAISGGK